MWGTARFWSTVALRLFNVCDKAKPATRRGRKATGPRVLREAMDDSPKDPKTAGLPKRFNHETGAEQRTSIDLLRRLA